LFDRLRTMFSKRKPAPPVVVDDAEFGRITFDDKHDWWSGEVVLGGKPLPLFVHAPSQGPSPRQREVWRAYTPKLPEISRTVIGNFIDQVEKHVPGRKKVDSQEFELDEVEVAPDEWATRVDFVLTYSLRGDDDGSWRFELLDGRVESSGRDD
jgi:hypothetical protein